MEARIVEKPAKPSKYKFIKRHTNFYFDFVSNEVNLNVFLKWIEEAKSIMPKGTIDISISLGEEFYYDDSSTWIVLSWLEPVKNTRYTSEMKRYTKQLARWKKQNAKH